MTRITPNCFAASSSGGIIPPNPIWYVYRIYGVLRTKPWNHPLRFADNPPDFGVRYDEFLFKLTPLIYCGTIKRANSADRRGSSNY
jgi:hypothetical protein